MYSVTLVLAVLEVLVSSEDSRVVSEFHLGVCFCLLWFSLFF